MATDGTIHTGGCQCGKVRYALHGPLERAHICHCRMCQRATGGLFAALVGVPKQRMAVTRGNMAFFDSSNLAKRGFCSDCGTPLSFAYNAEAARFYVTIGSLDHPESAPIEHQYGVESRLSWVDRCSAAPGEKTGESAPDFYATMQSHQSAQTD